MSAGVSERALRAARARIDWTLAPSARRRPLPGWPVWLLFAGYPLFWLMGLGNFAPALVGLVMAVVLWRTGGTRVPIGAALWAVFLVFSVVSIVVIDSPVRYVGYAMRISSYLGASIVFLYVYNLSARRFPTHRVLLALACFLAFVVLGGWLGVLFPHGRITTPLSFVLPGAVLSNDYVQALVLPKFAEVQQPWGAPEPFVRPAAPFAYTNGWGCNTALLVPLVLGGLSRARGWARWALIGVLGLAVVPAFATLNRGLFLALGLAIAYASVRLAMRGRWGIFLGVLAAATIAGGAAVVSGATAMLEQRLKYSETNADRTLLYVETFERTLGSPVLGYGSPQPSLYLNISVGTQGQLWNIMFSYGFVAVVAWLAWFAWVAVVSRHWNRLEDLWVHACLVIAFVTVFYYGYDGPQLTVFMVAAALALRRVRPPALVHA